MAVHLATPFCGLTKIGQVAKNLDVSETTANTIAVVEVAPWFLCPALTLERLQVLAARIALVRAEAVLDQRPDKGDGPWSLGCVAYSRTRFAISQLAESGQHPWLTVQSEGNGFAMMIEGVPVRLHRGDSESPTSRATSGASRAFNRLQASFPFMAQIFADEPSGRWLWMLTVETHEDGTALRIVIHQLNEHGSTRNHWEIPIDSSFPVIAPITSTSREPVDLPAPVVGPKLPAQRAASDASDDNHGEGN